MSAVGGRGIQCLSDGGIYNSTTCHGDSHIVFFSELSASDGNRILIRSRANVKFSNGLILA